MFILRFFRLALSVALEGLYNALRGLLFPFQRRRARQRVLSAMSRQPMGDRKRVLDAGIALVCLATLAGCGTTFPNSSFDRQVAELGESVKVLYEDTGWEEELFGDLRTLSDPEWGQLKESFIMLGW